jgi:hypothetical protein
MKQPTLSESAAPFARFAEPSEMAYEIAGTVENLLLKPHHRAYTIAELAHAIESDIAAFNKRYLAMENALGACSQTALIHGASEEEMRYVSKLIEEGDKA